MFTIGGSTGIILGSIMFGWEINPQDPAIKEKEIWLV
jgi:hypothetical protein